MTRQHSQLLTTVLLLIGLLTMHGVSSNHDPMPMMPGAVAAPLTMTAVTAQTPVLAPAGTASRAALTAAARGPLFMMSHPSCVAVLLSSLVLLLVSMLLAVKRRLRVRSSGPADSIPQILRISRAQPPPDPVAGLCVSRT